MAQARRPATSARDARARRGFQPRDLRRAFLRETRLRGIGRVKARTLQLPRYRRPEGEVERGEDGSAQIRRRIPGGEDEIFQQFTCTLGGFLGEHLGVGEGSRLALITEGDHRTEGVCLWNFKGFAGSVLVETGHLMSGEAESGGLKREVG